LKILSILFLLISISVAKADVLKVKAYSRVFETAQITLGDVVESSNLNLDTIKQLKKIILGDAPKLGEERIYSNSAIAAALRQSKINKNWKLQIPHQIKVNNKGFELDRESVEAELLSSWQNICSECQWTIKSVQMPALPKNLINQKWTIEADNKIPRGSFARKLTVLSDEGVENIFWINGQVEIKKKVPVLLRSVSMNARLTEEDFELALRDVTLATDSVPNIKEIVGQKVKFSMNANDIIWSNSLMREKAVQRGDVVKVFIGDSNWQVSTQGVTEQDGFIGDTVNVRNLQTRRVITGRVVGGGEVEVR
jgi:flagella basal body P-ring formation protein FlgA